MPFTYECAGCGEQVIRSARPQGARVFCSRDCYHKATIVYPDRECPQCRKVFSPRLGPRSGPRAGRIGRTYCSWDCFNATRLNSVTKTCPVCGEDFTVPASMARRYRTCSVACKTASTVYVDCERCGRRFANTDPKRLNRHYCSEECRRPPMILTCRNCKKEFREEPCQADRQFCSLACYRSFVGETRLEARIRVALEMLGVDFDQEFSVRRWSIDFALTRHRIAIEADGDYWHRISAARDARRDAHLARAGWRVVRLAESEVNSVRDLPQLILDRIRDVAGLDRADLVLSGVRPATAVRTRLIVQAQARKPFRMRQSRGPVRGQIALWGD